MDTNEIIAHSRARFDHATTKRVLKEKYQGKLIFAYRGGMWKAGPELCSLIAHCGRTGEIVLVDLYETPIKINAQELSELSQQRFHEQMNAWLLEFEQATQNR